MHDARAVANFFIDKAASEKRPLTIMTLLKVMYFAHAWHLCKHDKPLIGQPFEAWKYGPVNRVVYDQFKGLGKAPINYKAKSFDPIKSKFLETRYLFDAETEIFLTEMYNYYSKFHAFALSDLTHEKGSPWDKIWREASERAIPGMVIPNNLIRSWFNDRDTLYWTNRHHEVPS